MKLGQMGIHLKVDCDHIAAMKYIIIVYVSPRVYIHNCGRTNVQHQFIKKVWSKIQLRIVLQTRFLNLGIILLF